MLELFLAGIKNMDSRVRKMKKISLYEFQLAMFNKFSTRHKRFF